MSVSVGLEGRGGSGCWCCGGGGFTGGLVEGKSGGFVTCDVFVGALVH